MIEYLIVIWVTCLILFGLFNRVLESPVVWIKYEDGQDFPLNKTGYGVVEKIITFKDGSSQIIEEYYNLDKRCDRKQWALLLES